MNGAQPHVLGGACTNPCRAPHTIVDGMTLPSVPVITYPEPAGTGLQSGGCENQEAPSH